MTSQMTALTVNIGRNIHSIIQLSTLSDFFHKMAKFRRIQSLFQLGNVLKRAKKSDLEKLKQQKRSLKFCSLRVWFGDVSKVYRLVDPKQIRLFEIGAFETR
jgi:hypothetical protein